MKKYLAEFVGTFVLVFAGVGAAVLAGSQIGNLGVALVFGLTLVALIYTFGDVSGANFNPAVSAAMWSAGRISTATFAKYAVVQFAGATIAALLVCYIASGEPGWTVAHGLGQNGWGMGYAGEYSKSSAIIFELFATFIFVRLILELTEAKSHHAGLAIGLVLAALLMVGMNITGGSLNPARSFGPAVLVGGHALAQLWVFLVIPTVAGLAAGIIHRFYGFNKK
ncbi:MAG: aquaporin [Alphaproteobacteria bacterium]|nr:aquaporin [Alphaproteobacteria bacterium]